MFTKAELTIDRRSDTLVSLHATNEIATRDVPKDPAQTAHSRKVPSPGREAG